MIRQPMDNAGMNSARPIVLPAPVGGWNTRDSIAAMNPMDAVYLDNLFPRSNDVQLRKGRTTIATLPVGRTIRTLIGYKSVAAAVKQFAATQNGIYDITNPGSPTLATTSTKGDWEYLNVTTSGGSFVLACNGQDRMKLFNGTTWTDLDAASVPAITGITTSDVVNIAQYKTRVILCKKDSLSFWYLPTNAIAGAATEFPLQTVFSKGGYLMATCTWTIDGGNGPDDYFCAVTSEGEVVVYVGSDVAGSDFRKVGTFQLPPPLGRRCFKQLADDVLLMTKGAIYPLSKSLGRGLLDKRLALTDKIDTAWNAYSNSYGTLFGWEMVFFPEGQMLLVNAPLLDMPSLSIKYSDQFVVNTLTSAWCRFRGWNAETFSAFNGKLYCALGNIVWECWTGNADDQANIVGSAKTAFSALGGFANKHIKMLQPVIQSDTTVTIQLGVDMDYEETVMTASSLTYLQSLSRWNTAVWNQSAWNGSSSILAKWLTVFSKVGRVAAVRLRVSSKTANMSWIATNLLAEDAGLL